MVSPWAASASRAVRKTRSCWAWTEAIEVRADLGHLGPEGGELLRERGDVWPAAMRASSTRSSTVSSVVATVAWTRLACCSWSSTLWASPSIAAAAPSMACRMARLNGAWFDVTGRTTPRTTCLTGLSRASAGRSAPAWA